MLGHKTSLTKFMKIDIISSIFYGHNGMRLKKINVYVSLLSAMIVGRLLWGAVMFICMGLKAEAFGWSAFLAASVLNAVPGIVLQVVLIPLLVITLEKVVVKE